MTTAWNANSGVIEQATRRWQSLDPLLPPVAISPGCGVRLVVPGTDGQPVAIGACEHWEGAPGSLDPTWGAARRFRLTAATPGPDVPGVLDRLLSLWRDHLADVPGVDGEDTSAVVTWPSRDIDGPARLLEHGFAPLAVIAARPAGRPGAEPAASAAMSAGDAAETEPLQIAMRRASPADLDTVIRLGMEVIRFDAHFGNVTERPDTAEALGREAAVLLAGPEPWIWLAERQGTAIGMAYAERPEAAGWIAPMVRRAPVAYLELMGVVHGTRGQGVGAGLVRRLHREIDASGVGVTLLHYEQVNPLSGPFWSRHGYRPLWTSWEARPARVMR
jgi:GNAT superfamily N-acetyltransferase